MSEFTLARPLLLPDARAFSDVLEYLGEWSHDRDYVKPEPRYIPEVTPEADEWERSAWRDDGRNQIGPFCWIRRVKSIRMRSIAVRATDAVIDAVEPRIVTPDDHLSFEVIEHESTGRALVILKHGYIIGSHWLAYIDPETIPNP